MQRGRSKHQKVEISDFQSIVSLEDYAYESKGLVPIGYGQNRKLDRE